ncbi:DUF6882 domain-containing protein [Paractinoplanes durhamensis]|uniref:Uncharacterized protein n=1 Tax=Paractinoplanes durhamensis TaxID=113563 RepID=A0ABQ3YTB7_9ACTN|nr:DUF6882 domain-containing protein [Actinoplanes durhamensis]GIE00814.1 hypothetical protein Adu01nite_21640 [Actinoplanes durhamensis]
MTAAFDDLFSRNVVSAMARQMALADLLGERDWQVDIPTGSATFGPDLRFGIQLLGTESHGDGTWLWAWANTGSNLPPTVLHLGGWLREYGQNSGITELTDPTFPLDRADGHRLALIASGLTGRPYYRGPYDGGALFFHLEGVPPQEVTPERAITVLNQSISAFPMNHRIAVVSFLEQQGWRVEADETVTGHHPSGAIMRVTFDERGRIAQFSGNIKPPTS